MEKFNFGDDFSDSNLGYESLKVRKVREVSFEEGRRQGYDEGYNENQSRVTRQLVEVFSQISQVQQENKKFLSYHVLNLTQQAVEKLYPYFHAKAAEQEVELFVQTLLKDLKKVPHVTVKVHPEQVKKTSEFLDTIKNSKEKPCEIIVKSEDGLSLSDCIVEWGEGGACKLIQQVKNNVDKAFETLKSTLATPSENGGVAERFKKGLEKASKSGDTLDVAEE